MAKLQYCHICGNRNHVSKLEPRCIACKPCDKDNNESDIHYFSLLNNITSQSKSSVTAFWKYNYIDTVKLVEIEDLIQLKNIKSCLNIEDIFSNQIKSNRRILSIIQAWRNKIYIDIPTIDFQQNIFHEGRHRTLAAKYLGETQIPIRIKAVALL